MSFQNEKPSTQDLSLNDCEVIVVPNQKQSDTISTHPQAFESQDGGAPPPSCVSCGDAPRD